MSETKYLSFLSPKSTPSIVCNSYKIPTFIWLLRWRKLESFLLPSLSHITHDPSDNHVKFTFKFIVHLFIWVNIHSNLSDSWYHILSKGYCSSLPTGLSASLLSLKPLWSFKCKSDYVKFGNSQSMISIPNKPGQDLSPGDAISVLFFCLSLIAGIHWQPNHSDKSSSS